jgi:hypothetical protein
VAEAETYRRLATALDELDLWARLAPLLPFAVHHDHTAERAAEQARRLAQIPTQRRPVDLWPVPRPGLQRIQLPRRAQ